MAAVYFRMGGDWLLPYVTICGRIIPMYGLCMATGIVISSFLAYIRSRRIGKSGDSLMVILACAVGTGLVAAKLLYILVSYGVGNALEQLILGDITFLSDGGQVFYGGLLGGIAGACIGARIVHEKLEQFCDAIIPCVPLGHAFGRLGCFFAGCCYGMASDGPLGMAFPKVGVYHEVIPVQLIEAALNLVIFIAIMYNTRKHSGGYASLYLYLMCYAVSRFLLEFLRGDDIRGLSAGFSTSQWISIAVFIAVIVILLVSMYKRRKKLKDPQSV